MRRILAIACILPMLALTLPASAAQQVGTIAYPVAAPNLARIAWESGVQNGAIGWVARLPADADDKAYTLSSTGATGTERLDAYFYEDSADGRKPGEICTISADNGATERGTICPGSRQTAAWVIVVMVVGADATFSLSWR